MCCDYYRDLGKLSQTLQRVDYPIWSKVKAVEEYLKALQNLKKGKEGLPTYLENEAELFQCTFKKHPILLSDVGINMPLRETRSRAGTTSAAEPEVDSNQEQPQTDLQSKLHLLLGKATSLADHMTTHINQRFSPEFVKNIKTKEKTASLWPILQCARSAKNETEMMTSPEAQCFTSMHPEHEEESRNLCINLYRNRSLLAGITTETGLYHKVFTIPEFSLGAPHVMQKMAKILLSTPPESIVESMGSVIDHICTIRGGSKTSTNRRDIKDISDELKIHWNGPHITHSESLVKQSLKIYFKGGSWHFTTFDVYAKLHKVSKVVDRINATTPKLSFMA